MPEFEARLKYGLLSGELDLPASRYQEICDAAHFIATRWEWVDPLKDGQANILNIEAGLDSRQRVIAESERGGDTETVDAEQAEDIDSADIRNLSYGTPDIPTVAKGTVEDASGNPIGEVDVPKAPEKNGGKQPPRLAKNLLPGLTRGHRTMARVSELIEEEQKMDTIVDAVLARLASSNGHSTMK